MTLRAMTGLLVLLLASTYVAAAAVGSLDAQRAVLQQHNLTVSKQESCNSDEDCNPGDFCVRCKKRQNPDCESSKEGAAAQTT